MGSRLGAFWVAVCPSRLVFLLFHSALFSIDHSGNHDQLRLGYHQLMLSFCVALSFQVWHFEAYPKLELLSTGC